MTIRMHRGSANVFEDAGFPPAEAAHMLIRSQLTHLLTNLIRERGLTQKQAAKAMHVTQPRISDLVRGRFDLFSIDMLIEMLAHVEVSVTLKATRGKRVA